MRYSKGERLISLGRPITFVIASTANGYGNRLAMIRPLRWLVCMLVVIIIQVRSLSALAMTIFTAPIGLAGVVPTHLLFHVPFGFNAILGLIALAEILMRNTLI